MASKLTSKEGSGYSDTVSPKPNPKEIKAERTFFKFLGLVNNILAKFDGYKGRIISGMHGGSG